MKKKTTLLILAVTLGGSAGCASFTRTIQGLRTKQERLDLTSTDTLPSLEKQVQQSQATEVVLTVEMLRALLKNGRVLEAKASDLQTQCDELAWQLQALKEVDVQRPESKN